MDHNFLEKVAFVVELKASVGQRPSENWLWPDPAVAGKYMASYGKRMGVLLGLSEAFVLSHHPTPLVQSPQVESIISKRNYPYVLV